MAAFLLFAASQVHAHSGCGDRQSILNQLIARYQEQVVALGLSANGHVVEILVNEETRTWTMLATQPGNLTCVIQSGNNWERTPAEPPSSRS